ncbi:hypothetical protein MNBD_UNCLBAC01-214 [hydrothermal vent metagenome]|uniref:Uncharacterized protein n=1 Tax=hydrothermal vent metagenome TaxID=652676 RepID=A0A3B1E1W0_9ZZZZ
MKKIHFIIGVLGLGVFLFTGQYMHHVHNHLQGMEDGPRMLFRASHIYILLSSLVNLSLGVYLVFPDKGIRKYFQLFISLSAIVAPFLIILGFFSEPKLSELARPFTKYGLYFLFGSGLLLIMLGLSEKNKIFDK